MASEERTKEILEGLSDAVLAFDEEKAVKLSQAALNEGVEPYAAINDGLAKGMGRAGELFEEKTYFVPELLLCADAFYAGLNILKPAILASAGESKVKALLVIGVVEGDIHDIGKNLVKIMFEAAGWTVYDLGRDVKAERFVEEQVRTGAEVVALSSLVTTTMLGMPKVIQMLRAKAPKVRIIVGGAPLNEDIAKKFGANGYAKTAAAGVEVATRLIETLRKEGAGE